MRVNSLIVFGITVVCMRAAAVPSVAVRSSSCKYWCKEDNNRRAHYYCCPSGKPDASTRLSESMWPIMMSPLFWIGLISTSSAIHQIQTPMVIKKTCPPIRTVCPRSHEWNEPPQLCEHDSDCPGWSWEKCCYDVCLEHKVCKPAQ